MAERKGGRREKNRGRKEAGSSVSNLSHGSERGKRELTGHTLALARACDDGNDAKHALEVKRLGWLGRTDFLLGSRVENLEDGFEASRFRVDVVDESREDVPEDGLGERRLGWERDKEGEQALDEVRRPGVERRRRSLEGAED